MKSKVVFGLLLIVAAVLLGLQQLGLLESLGLQAGIVFPVLFLVLGLYLLIRDRNILAGGIIAWLASVNLFKSWAPWLDKLVLPGILVVIALELIFGHLFKRGKWIPQGEGADRVEAFAAFGGVQRKIQSASFKGGSVTALFGGVELDLTGIRLEQDAVLEVNAWLGGVEIKLPAGLRVRSELSGIFGGVDQKRRDDAAADGPVLILRGFAFMGGVEIK